MYTEFNMACHIFWCFINWCTKNVPKLASFIYYEISNFNKHTIHHVDDSLTLSKVMTSIYINQQRVTKIANIVYKTCDRVCYSGKLIILTSRICRQILYTGTPIKIIPQQYSQSKEKGYCQFSHKIKCDFVCISLPCIFSA